MITTQYSFHYDTLPLTRFDTPILLDLNDYPNVWTHVLHTILAFHSLNVRMPLEGNPHTIPINQLPIYVNSHAILFLEPVGIDLPPVLTDEVMPPVLTDEVIGSLMDSVKKQCLALPDDPFKGL